MICSSVDQTRQYGNEEQTQRRQERTCHSTNIHSDDGCIWEISKNTSCVQTRGIRAAFQQGGNTCFLASALQCDLHTLHSARQVSNQLCTYKTSSCASCMLSKTAHVSADPGSLVKLDFWNLCLESFPLTIDSQHDVGKFWNLFLARWCNAPAPRAKSDFQRFQQSTELPLKLTILK